MKSASREMSGFNFICAADFTAQSAISPIRRMDFIKIKRGKILMAENKLADMSTEFAFHILETTNIKGHRFN